MQDLLVRVSEADLPGLGTGKGRVGPIGHVGRDRFFVQQVQHTVGAGKHLGQACAKVGQRHHRAEGAQCSQRADQHPAGIQRTALFQMEADPQHGQDGQQDEGVGGTHRHALTVLQRLLLLPQRLAVGRNALGAVGGVLILQRIPQAAQVFQHIAVGVGKGLAVGAGGFVTASGRPHRQGRAHQQVARQQHQCRQQMIPGREAGHADDTDHRDADRRDGVGIKNFQLLDVGGDQADEVAAVAALQLGGAQMAERSKDPIADEGQQLEGDIMVGCLLGIPQHTAQQRKH